jgi:glycosyltransferase involved in cell wall biosynthesis
VVQEAFAQGVPVVASRIGALTEKVEDGRTGRLFSVGDSADLARVLGELVDEPQKWSHLRNCVSAGPTMPEHAERLVAIYQALCGGLPVIDLPQ